MHLEPVQVPAQHVLPPPAPTMQDPPLGVQGVQTELDTSVPSHRSPLQHGELAEQAVPEAPHAPQMALATPSGVAQELLSAPPSA